MNIYSDLIKLFWLVFVIYWTISAFNIKRNLKRGKYGIGLRFFAFLVIVFLVIGIVSSGNKQLFVPIKNIEANLLGVALCGLGIGVAIWARIHLGRNWGQPMSIKENPELVISGPYKYIRNPIYSGIILALFGTSLVGGLIWFLVFLICSSYFIYSSKVEEKIMENEFPRQYPGYKARTKMLVPFIF